MKITHVMLGTNDIDKARVFYDAVLSALGYAPTQHDPHRATYVAPDTPQFMIGAPYDGRPATFGNGVMTGFAAGSAAEVDAFYTAAMNNGGRCEGPPGPRDYAPGVYAAYVRDPDGNKLSVLSLGNVTRTSD
jgi:catechol 2,3-dioxygenase-like lactoylglutathione lyase family enzyme